MGLDNLDELIEIVRKASSNSVAAAELMKGTFLLILSLVSYLSLSLPQIIDAKK